jgi:hypothetical protein
VYEWTQTSQLKLAIDKCFVVHFGFNNPEDLYFFDNDLITPVDQVRDLGIQLASNFKFSAHCSQLTLKCVIMINCIFAQFYTRDVKFLLSLFSVFVKPILEYGSEVWSPHLLKDIRMIEKVLRKFTKRLPGYNSLSYEDRLKALNLRSLEESRIIKDLILTYKLVHNLLPANAHDFFIFATNSATRGNSLKIQHQFTNLDLRKYFFSNRVVPVWNSLPDNVVTSISLRDFKNRLGSISFQQFCKGWAS